MHRLFTDDDRAKKPNLSAESIPRRPANSNQEREIRAFAKCFSRMDDKYRALVFQVASKMASRAAMTENAANQRKRIEMH
jgi:hypothetical protein